jgi:predicted solute-binding protein
MLAEQNLTADPNDSFVFVKCIKNTSHFSKRIAQSDIDDIQRVNVDNMRLAAYS